MPHPSDTHRGTYLAAIVDGQSRAITPISAEALVQACDALGRAAEKVDKKTKTHAGLVNLYNLMFDFLCAVRHAEGPEPLTSPLRKDPA